jgi:hypothetical protein
MRDIDELGDRDLYTKFTKLNITQVQPILIGIVLIHRYTSDFLETY